MQHVYISLPIMNLGRSAVEKILLAHLCERAAQDAGQCTDSNTTLAEALGLHSKTVSGLINQLGEAMLILVTVDKELANKRTLRPLDELVTDYPVLADSTLRVAKDYPPIMDSTSSDYPSKPDSPYVGSKLKAVSARTKRLCPITNVDITYQRANCQFITITTLDKLFRNDRPAFDQLVIKFLQPSEVSESIGTKCYLLAERVRKLAKTQI